MKKILRYFSPFEWCLWAISSLAILLSFLFSGEFHILTLIASLLGVAALLFLAKGNVIGQFLVIIFSLLYAIVSWEQRYYGEMITYVFMSLPAAVCACVSWLKNPSKNAKNEVQVATMSLPKWIFLSSSSVLVTLLFFFVLRYFQTNNLPVSTLSVTTSYLASVLLIFRCHYYALAYAANDIVLIVLWVYACFSSLSYLSMVICFCAFLFNDIYAFYNWKRIQKRQNEQEN